MRPDRVTLAKVRRPQGLGGELRLDVCTDFPEHLRTLKEALLERPDGRVEPVRIESVRPVRDGVVLKTSAASSIEEARGLVGAELCVPRDQAWPLPEGHHYIFDLIGCSVFVDGGERVGSVSSVEVVPTSMLRVESAAGHREVLIPFCDTICYRVEPERGEIWIRPPEGLLDLNAV
ncbi:MAG: ribosome maturation factor RimM [Acidobacteriota bacterium]